MAVWTPYKNVGEPVVLEATETIVAGDPVKLATNGISKSGNGDPVFGVAATDIASGANGSVWTKGIFKVSFGATLVMGARVAAAASGQVDAGSSADEVVGVVVEADTASGAVGKILLYSDSKHAIA